MFLLLLLILLTVNCIFPYCQTLFEKVMLMDWCISHIIAYWAISLSLALLSFANSSLSQIVGPSTPPCSIFEPLLAQSPLRDEGIEIGTRTETSLGCCWHICVPLATSKRCLSDQVKRPTAWGVYSSCYVVFVTSCSAVQSTFYFCKSSHHWII